MPQVIPAAVALISTAATALGAAGASAGAIGAALGTTILGGAFTVGQAIGLAVSVAGTLLGSLSGPSAPSVQAPTPPALTPQISQAEIYEPVRYRYLGVGEWRSSGSVIFHDNDGANDDGDLWKVIVYDCHQISEVTSVAFGGEVVTLDEDGWVQSPARWQNNVQIKWTHGEDDPTAFAELVAAFPGRWTAAHQGKGLACAMVRQKPVAASEVDAAYPNRSRGEKLTLTAKRAVDVFDPRTGLTGWTDNAALVALWWLTSEYGFGKSLDDIRLEDWASAADKCDVELETVAGVLVKRYRAAGQISLDGDKGEIFRQLLENFDAAFTYDDDGKIGVRMSNPDDQITIQRHQVIQISAQHSPGLLTEVKGVRSVFVDPDLGYNNKTTVPYPRPPVPGTVTAAEAANGATEIQITPGTLDADALERSGIQGEWYTGRMFWLAGTLYTVTAVTGDSPITASVFPTVQGAIPAGTAVEAPASVTEVERPFCPSWSQAMRLDKRRFLREAAPETTITGTLSLLDLRVPRTLYLGFEEAGDLRRHRLTGKRLSDDGNSVDCVLRSIHEDYDLWQEKYEGMINPLARAVANGRLLEPPAITSTGSETGGGQVWAVWDAPVEEVASMQVMRSDPGANTWRDQATIAEPDERLAFLDLGDEAGLVDLRFRFLTTNGAATAWAVVADVDPFTVTGGPPDLNAISDSTPPPAANNPPTNTGGQGEAGIPDSHGDGAGDGGGGGGDSGGNGGGAADPDADGPY